MVALPIENIDTDQIIPARYLKMTDRSGLAEALFADWRYDTRGEPRPDFPLNRPGSNDARVLVAGPNFGCGSSREHAAWALLSHGFQAIVSTGFADIFGANALRNGLLPIALDPAAYARLAALLDHAPQATITVDLEAQTVTLPDQTIHRFPIDAFDRHCLLHGIDRLGFLLELEPTITQFEANHSYPASTLDPHA